MLLVINHLTRMAHPYVCIAGLNEHNRHVRPVLGRRIRRDELEVQGGRITLGAVVDFGPMQAVGRAPEIEDHLFDPAIAVVRDVIDGPTLWSIEEQAAHDTFVSIFGPELQRSGRSYALPEGKGIASLGVVEPRHVEPLTLEYGKLRMRLDDGLGRVVLPVTDLRLCEEDQTTVRQDAVDRLNAELATTSRVLLSVGVSRAWSLPGSPPGHWLQVNNLFLGPT